MSEVVLIRGLPGSGKSTMAKRDFGSHVHCEADAFFVGQDGVYRYNPKMIKSAHEWCQRQVDIALRNGHNVVVSNTFTRLWEMDAYRAIAERRGAEVRVIVARGSYGNIHGVPSEAIDRMRARWED